MSELSLKFLSFTPTSIVVLRGHFSSVYLLPLIKVSFLSSYERTEGLRVFEIPSSGANFGLNFQIHPILEQCDVLGEGQASEMGNRIFGYRTLSLVLTIL